MVENGADLRELQHKVGVSEELTDEVLRSAAEMDPCSALLPLLNLLLLERYKPAVELIRKVVREFYDLDYIKSLQKSRFYKQRMSVPQIALDIPVGDRKEVLKASLRDPAVAVVEEAVISIVADNPFDEEELCGIARGLIESRYMAVRILAVDILGLRSKIVPGSEETRKLLNLMLSMGWRSKLRCAINLERFAEAERDCIITALMGDEVEEVRAALAKHLDGLEYLELLKDPSELVRARYLANVVGKIQDEKLLAGLINDPSWEVRQQLLGLGGGLFQKIAVPLIKSSDDKTKWRFRFEVLELVGRKLDDEDTIRSLMEYLIEKLVDRVHMIRKKAGKVLVAVVGRYAWAEEWKEAIEAVASSTDYLHRLAAVPVVIAFDNAFGTELGEKLRDDMVENVRYCYSNFKKAGVGQGV